ncbi:MAG: phosphotransferase [Bacteroidetes bacterium]|nr:phosphotransferase [Bacteroidota bacterium]
MSEFTDDQLLKIIQEHLPDTSLTGEIVRLSGGNINYVWRAKGKNQHVIVKHAPPHIATNPDVPLSNSRIDFEARALATLNQDGKLSEIATLKIRPPRLYSYDKERSLLIMEDLGDFTELDQSALISCSPKKIGEQLGRFIGNLHRTTFRDEEFYNAFNNSNIQRVRNQMQYQPAFDYIRIDDRKLSVEIRKRRQDLGRRLLKKGKCLVMGDLWPPSVSIIDSEEIRLIDWEFVHFGRPLQDVEHFAAHCWMQEQVQNSTQTTDRWNQLWEFFLEAYKRATGSMYSKLMDEQELNDIGIHIGTEILMRTYGPFKSSYIYDGFEKDHPCMKKAKEKAVDFILNAERCCTEFGF